MTELLGETGRWWKIKMKQEDLEMDDAADITRGCVDPAVNLCVSVGQVGTLLSVLTLIKPCRYCERVTEGHRGNIFLGYVLHLYVRCFPTVSSSPRSINITLLC